MGFGGAEAVNRSDGSPALTGPAATVFSAHVRGARAGHNVASEIAKQVKQAFVIFPVNNLMFHFLSVYC